MLARLKPVCSSRCGSGLFSGGLCQPADFGTKSFCFLFQEMFVIHLLLDPGLVPERITFNYMLFFIK